MTQLVLSLGSNIEREKHIRFGISELRRLFGTLRVSPVYETAAVGFSGPDFFNLVAVADTELKLEAVIDRIQAIETVAGRVRGEKKFQDRSLDIDILLFGDADLHPQGYDIPRHEIEHAGYVLKPLSDLLPQQQHPVSGETYIKMWQVRMAQQPPMNEVEMDLARVDAA